MLPRLPARGNREREKGGRAVDIGAGLSYQYNSFPAPVVEWQTRKPQELVPARVWRFNSSPVHHFTRRQVFLTRRSVDPAGDFR